MGVEVVVAVVRDSVPGAWGVSMMFADRSVGVGDVARLRGSDILLKNCGWKGLGGEMGLDAYQSRSYERLVT